MPSKIVVPYAGKVLRGNMFELVADLSASVHRYLCLEPNPKVGWQDQLAEVYVDLRGGSPTPFTPIIFEGVQILDVSGLPSRIETGALFANVLMGREQRAYLMSASIQKGTR